MKEKTKPLVIVEWGDAWSNNGAYYNEGEDYEPSPVRSVGWMMEHTDTVIVLCTDYFPNEIYRKLTSIPVVNIISITELV